jgi:hypothetical protein
VERVLTILEERFKRRPVDSGELNNARFPWLELTPCPGRLVRVLGIRIDLFHVVVVFQGVD